jgi:hypothetical protein
MRSRSTLRQILYKGGDVGIAFLFPLLYALATGTMHWKVILCFVPGLLDNLLPFENIRLVQTQPLERAPEDRYKFNVFG